MDEKQLLLEAWKTTITSQSHFNEMGMKLRSFALTLVAAILTAESLANAGGLAILAALVSWVAFYLLDRWYYFYLLLGAVRHGEALEDRARELGMALPGVVDSAESLLGLTHRVSRLNQEGWKWLGKYKLDLYYLLIGVAILMILCLRAVD
jgi:uncharacterized membrane protein